MRTLITGAGGQLGPDLIAAFAARGQEVIATDVVEAPAHTAAHSWLHLDVTDAAAVDRVIGDCKPDRIVHLAAVLSAKGERDPARTYAINQDGTKNVLDASVKHDVSMVLFTSSIAVFGPDAPSVAPDAAELLPTTMYGVTKAAGEMLGNYYRSRYGLDFRGVRYPGVIGATLPGGGTSDYALYLFYDAVRVGAYQAFCRPDTRIPLMYMPDSTRALVELADAPRDRLTRCVYNVAAFSPTAEEIAAVVREHVPGADLSFEPDPVRQGILDSWPDELDDSLARRDWGWRPSFDLSRMASDLIPLLRDIIAAHR